MLGKVINFLEKIRPDIETEELDEFTGLPKHLVEKMDRAYEKEHSIESKKNEEMKCCAATYPKANRKRCCVAIGTLFDDDETNTNNDEIFEDNTIFDSLDYAIMGIEPFKSFYF